MGPYYRPLVFRPRGPSPLLGHPELSQTFNEMLGMPQFCGDVIRLMVHGVSAYLGMYVGDKERGVLSAVGWTFGTLNAFGALIDGVSLVKRAAGTHPPE